MIAVISCDGTMLGLFTSQVDAWKEAKPVGAAMWRCAPNSAVCERIECEWSDNLYNYATYLVCPSHPQYASSISPSMPRVTEGIRPYALCQGAHFPTDSILYSITRLTH